jgi:iduronate 2-sulfatase
MKRFIAILCFYSLACVVSFGRPNVLFIATDDLRVELGCYGQSWIHSPNLDKLASQSTRFDRAYCQAALCNPSRASVMTGLYPDTIGVIDLPTHFRHVAPEVITLPEHFKNNGYFTQNIGKVFHNWHHGDMDGDPQSWSVPAELHYNTHSKDVPTPASLIEGQNNRFSKLLRKRADNFDVPDEAYWDGKIAEKAITALRRFKDSDQSFFLAVGFWKPHLPFNAPAKYWRYYLGDESLKPLLQPQHPDRPDGMPDLASHSGRELMRDFEEGLDSEQVELFRQGYYAAVSYVDAQVGKVLDALEALNLNEDTLVVFWSDHGFHLGEKGLWCKNSCYDLDTRVPLMIRLPGQKKGRSSQSLVELVDLYPTLQDLCDLPKVEPIEGQPLQGRSLAPVLRNPSHEVREAAFSQIMRPAYSKLPDREAMGYTIRTDRYRFTQWAKWVDGMIRPDMEKILAEELYDLNSDPQELNNLAQRPQLNTVLLEHRKQLLNVIESQRKSNHR